jgi:hypothetical protein
VIAITEITPVLVLHSTLAQVVNQNLAGSVTPVALELFLFLIASVVLLELLCVLLELQSTMEAVTAVVAELFTTILNARYMQELLVMAFTLTLVLQLHLHQALKPETVLRQTCQTHLTHVFLHLSVALTQQEPLVRCPVLVEE